MTELRLEINLTDGRSAFLNVEPSNPVGVALSDSALTEVVEDVTSPCLRNFECGHR